MSKTLKLAVIPGDGIGTEVVAEGLKVLDVAAASHGLSFDRAEYDLGARRYNAHRRDAAGVGARRAPRRTTRILLGAVGDPTRAAGRARAGPAAQAALRARPPRQPASGEALPRRDHAAGGQGPGATSTSSSAARAPRARTPAPAAGLRQGTPHEIATEESVNTAFGVERIVRDAFDARDHAPRNKVTLVHKTNVLVHAGRPVAAHRSTRSPRSSPTSRTDYCHVDAASMFFLTQPERFDVVVTDNLFGDILTDIGAAIAGGIGLAASGNIDPSAHEPEHVRAGPRLGAGHRRPGQGRPDGHGALASRCCSTTSAQDKAAAEVEAAVAADLAARGPGRSASTSEIGDALAARVAG